MSRFYSGWAPYVSVAERRAQAEDEIAKLRRKGQTIAPVIITKRAIASTFWGKAWCDNLERYRDFAYRLERGRSYVRNRAVLDLQIAPLAVNALVSGSSIYKVRIAIAPAAQKHWQSICRDCAGGIDSLVELLQGRLSTSVMERICRQGEGLFPHPKEIKFSCSCPDFASMCKHVAAVLYGIGARLDEQPELLFRLRSVDEQELLARLDTATLVSAPAAGKILADDDMSALFGLDMADAEPPAASPPVAKKKAGRPAKPDKAKAAKPDPAPPPAKPARARKQVTAPARKDGPPSVVRAAGASSSKAKAKRPT